LNATLLVALFVMYQSHGISALAIGWLAGTGLLFLYNALVIWRVVRPGRHMGSPAALTPFMKLVLSVALLEMIAFVYPTVDRALAARYLGDGQIAALRYSFFLSQLPPGLLVVTFSLASFPWISDYSVPSAKDKLLALYRQSLGLVAFTMLPIVCGMILFAPEIVRVAFQRGAFDVVSTQLTTGPFVVYSAGLLFYSVYIYQMRYYYAGKLILRLGIILASTFAIKVVASLLLVGAFEHEGLALGTAVAWVAGLVILTVDLGRALGLTPGRDTALGLARLLPATTLTVGFWLALNYVWPIASETTLELIAKLVVHGLAGALLYFGLTFFFGLSEPHRVVRAIRDKFRSYGARR
ncbi:MAG: oligosaccharide flippase family protein, partial [candidate division Zixibacteria bacterium]|nr:oligosaccharide flippase family protein [candidate division Zixibacteria bacterium]